MKNILPSISFLSETEEERQVTLIPIDGLMSSLIGPGPDYFLLFTVRLNIYFLHGHKDIQKKTLLENSPVENSDLEVS